MGPGGRTDGTVTPDSEGRLDRYLPGPGLASSRPKDLVFIEKRSTYVALPSRALPVTRWEVRSADLFNKSVSLLASARNPRVTSRPGWEGTRTPTCADLCWCRRVCRLPSTRVSRREKTQSEWPLRMREPGKACVGPGAPQEAGEKQAPCPSRPHRAQPGVEAARGHVPASPRAGRTATREEADCKARMQMGTWDPRVQAPPLQEACGAAGRWGEPPGSGEGRTWPLSGSSGYSDQVRGGHSGTLSYPVTVPHHQPENRLPRDMRATTRNTHTATTHHLLFKHFIFSFKPAREEGVSIPPRSPPKPSRSRQCERLRLRLEQAARKLSKAAGGELGVSVQHVSSVLHTEPARPFSGPRHRGAGLVASADISPPSSF